jgi:glucokinase
MDQRFYVGMDIGRSKIAVGLVSGEGRILRKKAVRTNLSNGGENIIRQSISLIEGIIASTQSRVFGIGICTIGIVDPKEGVIKDCSVSALTGVPIKRIIEGKFGLPTIVDNDLHCPAWGEYKFGASRGSKLAVYLTISSGAGISTIRNGMIDHGVHYLAGFIGNACILKNGSRLESAFSGTAIAERTGAALGRKVTTEEAFRLARNKSNPAYKIIKNAEHYAACTVAAVQMSIDPDIIVLGGSVATNQAGFVANIKRTAEVMIGNGAVQMPNGINIRVSALGKYNGVLGSAAMAMQKRQVERRF